MFTGGYYNTSVAGYPKKPPKRIVSTWTSPKKGFLFGRADVDLMIGCFSVYAFACWKTTTYFFNPDVTPVTDQLGPLGYIGLSR